MATSKLMTNILDKYYIFLCNESKRTGQTKRVIIEKGIKLYAEQKRIDDIRKSYKKMGKDKEYLNEMTDDAELGMQYFLEDIND